MATVYEWTPFGVALDITATNGGVTRTSATQYTVKINASWETYYNGAQTNYGMTASSGGGSVTLNPFGTYASNGSGSFTGTYTISGNGSANKTISVTFRNFNNDNNDSATKTVSFDVTVPAWTSYTVSYNANGGSGAPSSQTKWKNQTLTLSSTKPTRSGYTFVGWGTSASDTTSDYSAGGSYTANASATLYAIWKKSITLSYNANGGSGAPSSQSATIYNATTSYSFTLSSTKPTKTGHTFLGWSTSSTATSASYAAGASVSLSNSTTLYAVWRANILTVRHHVNGGKITSDTYYVSNNLVYRKSTSAVYEDKWNYNETHTYGLADAATFGITRDGYNFVGWKVGSSGATVFSDKDSSVVPTDLSSNITTGDRTVTLYAVWEISGVVYIDNGTTLEPYHVYIDNGSGWDLYIPYIDNGSSWDVIS